MPERADLMRPVWQDRLRTFREEVSSLVKTMPGPVSSLSLKVGAWQLEVTWAYPAQSEDGSAATPVPALLAVVPGPDTLVPVTDERDVVAPIVGTFYHAPEPGAEPFVQKGDRIEAGQVVGIVEAMKLMNQVPSEWAGEVLEVLASDAQSVEFGQPLVRIRLEKA